MRKFAIIAALLVIAVPTMGQTCQLAVNGSLGGGNTLSIDLTDSIPDALTLLAVGQTAGSTTFSFGMLGGFTLDLDSPFVMLPVGVTDANGDWSLSIASPAGSSVPASLAGTTLILQTVTIDLSFSFGGGGPPTGGVLNTCVSNTANLTL